MKKGTDTVKELEEDYARKRQELSGVGYISQGSVLDRTQRPGGGAGYQWTRKVGGKTVTVALTKEQFEAMREAVANKRKLTRLLSQMEKISRQILFQNLTHPSRRKRLNKKVLGII